MRMTVGEISKVLGMTTENIRYYVREGLIKPEKNKDNNYWEYSSEDVLYISDILFYRSMGISIDNIRKIFSGIPLESIGEVIDDTISELIGKIKEYTFLLESIQGWQKEYNLELSEIGQYKKGKMPPSLRVSSYQNDDEHIVDYLKGRIVIEKNDWQDVCISFYYNMNDEDNVLHKYISVAKTEERLRNNRYLDIIEEPEKICLITHTIFSDNVEEMINPLIKYAEDNGIILTGEFYGRERTNFYIEGKRNWVCSIYAPIERSELDKMNKILTEYLDNHKEQMIKDLGDFVAIPSVSEDLPEVNKALDYILNLGEKMGLTSINCLDGQVGVIEMGDGDETLGILTHVDVVDPGDMDVWETDPYKLTLIDDKLFGRGTIDDKGMVMASLYAMKAVKELGLPLKKKVQLIMGTQEEVDWTDMNNYVKEYPLPDYGFTPDGEYPICNIEKGCLDLDFEFDITEEFYCSDGKRYLKELNIGTASNVVSGKATAILSDDSAVTASGKSVHSCQPELGNNAIFMLDKKLSDMGLESNRLLDVIHTITESFEDVYGEKLGLKSESEYYMGEYVHVNCFAPTIVKTKDGKLKVHINVRYPYGASCKEITDTIEKLFGEHGGKLVKCESLPAVFVRKDAPFLSKLAEAYESVTSLENRFTLAYGGSYAKAMPNIVSWGPLFEGEEDTCHCENEYIFVDSLMASAKIFAQSIASIALSDESFK